MGGGVLVVRPRRGGGVAKVGGLRATHYYHMPTSRGNVCVGVWGYGGLYAIIELLVFAGIYLANLWLKAWMVC